MGEMHEGNAGRTNKTQQNKTKQQQENKIKH